ncbi:MAG: hypothetical protein HDR11_00890 [Lachnospiraceae bacterium]|nr:hypothetical protein [Lachnospiraceae bacterium]
MGMRIGKKKEREQNIPIRQRVKVIFSKIAKKLVAISPALFAVLVSALVLWNQYNSRVTLTNFEMNVIFFAMFAISLILTVWTRANKRKCIWLIGISVAIIEVYFYNRPDSDSGSVLAALISFQNDFNNVWSKLLLFMLLYLLIVSIRVIRWSQEDWEEIRKFNSETHKQRKKAVWEAWTEWWEARREKHRKKREKKQERAAFFAGESRKEREAEAGMRECRRKANRQELEANLKKQEYLQEMSLKELQQSTEEQSDAEGEQAAENGKKTAEQKREEEEARLKEQKKRRNAIIIIVAILIIYMLLPIFGGGEQSPAWNWRDDLQNFVHELSGDGSYRYSGEAEYPDYISEAVSEIISDTKAVLRVGNTVKYTAQKAANEKSHTRSSKGKESFASSLAQYTIFFIAFAGMLYVGVVLLYRLAIQCIESFSNKDNKNGLSDFFNEYSTPLSVLIVATAMLSTFAGTDPWTFDKLPELFKNMASIILCILLVLITVDAVRLILKQCVEQGSLLRTSMHITFALLLDCVMGIVIGVLAELNLRGLLSSIFAFFLQGNRTPIYDKAEDLLDEALEGEMHLIRHARKMRQGRNIPQYRKRRTQKRTNKKTQSAFQNFHNKYKGRRS